MGNITWKILSLDRIKIIDTGSLKKKHRKEQITYQRRGLRKAKRKKKESLRVNIDGEAKGNWEDKEDKERIVDNYLQDNSGKKM